MNTPTTGADSPTPRTDKAQWDDRDYYEGGGYDFARQLERELTEARAEVEEHKAESKYRGEMSDSWRKSYGERLDEVHALRAQLAALEQDKARMDWLEASLANENDTELGQRESGFFFMPLFNQDRALDRQPTLRAAIDAAINSTKPTP
jgi:hypothetical protein